MRSETDRNYKPGFNDLQGGHDDALLLIPYGRPNQERCPLPLLTVLLLLTGEHLEEVGGEKNERAGPLGCGLHSRGLFLPSQKVPPKVLGEMMGEFRSHLES